jgi:hypothetical protein
LHRRYTKAVVAEWKACKAEEKARAAEAKAAAKAAAQAKEQQMRQEKKQELEELRARKRAEHAVLHCAEVDEDRMPLGSLHAGSHKIGGRPSSCGSRPSSSRPLTAEKQSAPP